MGVGRGRVPAGAGISAADFHALFDKKVSDIQKSTADAPEPDYTATDTAFPGFQPVTTDEVTKALLSSPNKQSATDPLPTWLLKECAAELNPNLFHSCAASSINHCSLGQFRLLSSQHISVRASRNRV